VYLSDEFVDTAFGGILSAQKIISETNTLIVDGEEVDITNRNSLRNGFIACFKLVNYDAAKPDTSSPLQKAINEFKDEFYRNFIQENRWTYLLQGLGNTLAITALALVIGVVIGFLVAAVRCTCAKTGKLKILDGICKIYLAIMRGTPVMIQLLIIYFVILLPLGVNKFIAAVLCFGINSGAYVSEIVRGGIMSIDDGQIEAGRSLGLGYVPTMWYIVIPQAFKAILPSLANEFIALLKETSVAFYIGVADLTLGGLKIRAITYSNFMPLIAIAVVYLVLVLGLSYLVSLLERRLHKSEK
jgi:His/Glu/Gln/Arg/opine family amino acid ABC transporter permease subunit